LTAAARAEPVFDADFLRYAAALLLLAASKSDEEAAHTKSKSKYTQAVGI